MSAGLHRCGEICHSPGVDQVGALSGTLQSVVSREDDAAGLDTSTAPLVCTGQDALPASTPLPSQALSAPDFKGLEDRILTQALETVDDALRWADIEGDEDEPPQEWVDEVGLKRAQKRLRVVKAALKNAKEAPVALGMARTTATGIMKIRAAVKMGTPTLNIALVSFPAPSVPLEVIDIGGDDK